jgi:hypothetical protein
MGPIAALVGLVLLAGCAQAPTEYDRYAARCHDKGGVVSVVTQTWTTSISKCTGDQPGELLPRFGGN